MPSCQDKLREEAEEEGQVGGEETKAVSKDKQSESLCVERRH